jgi:hypothetical protein
VLVQCSVCLGFGHCIIPGGPFHDVLVMDLVAQPGKGYRQCGHQWEGGHKFGDAV